MTTILLVILFFLMTVLFLILWTTHLTMNKDQDVNCGFATFNQFYERFSRCRGVYVYDKFNKGSIFIRNNGYPFSKFPYEAYLHAGIIRFEEGCMNMYPIDYILYEIWKYQYIKQARISETEKFRWSEILKEVN